MYLQGASSFNWYAFYHQGEREELLALCQSRLERVKNDFKEGKLHSFYQVAEWIYTREIYRTISLKDERPFDDQKTFIPLLQKMAYLGIPEAQSALYFIFSAQIIGEGENKIQFHLPLDARILGLKTLIHQGHSLSSFKIWDIFSNKHLGNVDYHISEEDQRKELEELIKLDESMMVVYLAEGRLNELRTRQMEIVAKHYIPEIVDLNVEEIQQVPDEVKQTLKLQSVADRSSYVLNLALKGRQLSFISRHLKPTDPLIQKILQRASNHLKAISSYK